VMLNSLDDHQIVSPISVVMFFVLYKII